MKICLTRKKEPFHFEAINEFGHRLPIDGSVDIGGNNQGFRPMELLIAGLAGCSSIDVLAILRKQKLELDDLRVTVNAIRTDQVPSLFKEIHIHFLFYGDVTHQKVQRAIELSLDKYCSVAKILEPTCKIDFSYDII